MKFYYELILRSHTCVFLEISQLLSLQDHLGSRGGGSACTTSDSENQLGISLPTIFYSFCQRFSKCVPRPGVSLSTEDLLEVLGPRLRPTESNSEGEAQESFNKPSRYFRCAPKFENHWLLESRVGTHRSGPCTRARALSAGAQGTASVNFSGIVTAQAGDTDAPRFLFFH